MKLAIYMCLLLLSCNSKLHKKNSLGNVALANAFIDAFYSYNKDSLQRLLSAAERSRPSILYYQKWAECGNYKIMARDKLFEKNDSLVIAPVTVKDDLMRALNIDFNVTDTFHLIIRNGRINSVRTSSNDLEIYNEAFNWIKQYRPSLIEKPCEEFGKEGSTPCDCVHGMIKGFTEFALRRKDSIP